MGQKDLPLASGRKHAAAFARCGWTEQRRRQGSNHIIMTKADHPSTLSIPDHDEVKRRTLQVLIQAAGLTEAEYLDCFGKRSRKNASK
ncbi:MAG TPA: type II toxin-antitoxin system HicA family toxin [Actinomycetota bacterium]|nr:type II toxin-antitoxin system HicA family toxin [Actinomycetota bacterium]